MRETKKRWGRKIFWIVVGLIVLLLMVVAFMPKPVPVDMAEVARGGLMVTVDEDGETRIREKYEVSTPLDGRLMRIELDPGDEVVAGDTLLAALEPIDPSLLDTRTRAQAEARVKAAEAAEKRANADLEQAKAALDFAKKELVRSQALYERGNTSRQMLDDAIYKERSATEKFHSSELAVQIAEFELEQARAALIHSKLGDEGLEKPESWRFDIPSPINGRVLKVLQESSAVVTAGTVLLEIGDPKDLEIQIDVLSRDAVKIEPGARVLLEHWGGDDTLKARVRLVEPSAFTKISALGVEEQRVYVLADFDEPVERWKMLGDGFRVEARIVIWEGTDVLKIPSGALFRKGEDWAVFAVVDGKAKLKTIKIDHNNGLEVQVLEGLEAGGKVILHPSDRVEDGVKVEPRG